jgi:hypothetical protein
MLGGVNRVLVSVMIQQFQDRHPFSLLLILLRALRSSFWIHPIIITMQRWLRIAAIICHMMIITRAITANVE